MELVNISRRNLVDVAHSQIRQMILDGVWKEGEGLPSENKLCVQLGVSRVVVREVLQRLRAEKLIITHQGIGSFVSNPNNYATTKSSKDETFNLTEQKFLKIMEFRKYVEYPILELAVQRRTDEDLVRIEDALNKMVLYVDDVDKFTEVDYQFHAAIAMAANNEMLTKAWESCREELYSCFYQMNRVNDVLNWGVSMHRSIYDAIVKRDLKKALATLKNANNYDYTKMSQFFVE